MLYLKLQDMKQLITLALIIIVSSTLQAQTVISGKITNTKKEPIISASITIKETGTGADSDSAGFYKIITGEKGNKTLVVSSIGYNTKEVTATSKDTSLKLDIVLKEESKQLGEVVVSAGSFEASDKAKGASLSPMDAVTVAGSGADLANSLRSLPGAQQIGEKEGLFVRGGTNEEAKQFVDGTLLKNPNFSPVPGLLQPARLNPFLFKGILFNTGAYSALYGDALSSALILETIDLPDESAASLHIFPMSVGAGLQKLAKDNKISYGVNTSFGTYNLYNKGVKQNIDFFHAPEYLTTDANIHIKTSNTGILKFYTNYGYNHTGLRNRDIDSSSLFSSFENKATNVYTNISYRESLGNNWKVDAGLAYNYSIQDVHNKLENENREQLFLSESPYKEKNKSIVATSNFAQARIVLSKKLNHNQAIRFGGEYFYNDDQYNYDENSSHIKDGLTALFAETDVYITNNIAAKVGLRTEYSSLLDKINIVPRISAGFRLNNGGQFNVGYGIFYQKPDLIYLVQQKNLTYAKADHYIINYIKKANNRLYRIEAYYKNYRDLLTTKPVISNNGDGYAKGVEIFFRDKKTFKGFDYWITYTYLDTKRRYDNYPTLLQPTFATPHTASVAIKRFFSEIKFSANLSYAIAGGRPYYEIRDDAEGHSKVFTAGKTNMYNQMNLSFAYLFTIFKKWKKADFSGIGFGINNVFGTQQIFGYNFSHDGFNRMPITLPATRSYYFGLFMSFGIDMTDKFINDNL
jgi:vitamin B12 transporter